MRPTPPEPAPAAPKAAPAAAKSASPAPATAPKVAPKVAPKEAPKESPKPAFSFGSLFGIPDAVQLEGEALNLSLDTGKDGIDAHLMGLNLYRAS